MASKRANKQRNEVRKVIQILFEKVSNMDEQFIKETDSEKKGNAGNEKLKKSNGKHSGKHHQ
jgi:hypothetical protein